MWNLKYDTNNPTYKIERTDGWLPRERGLRERQSERLGLADISYYT